MRLSSLGTARSRGRGPERIGHCRVPAVTDGRKSRTRLGWDASVSATAWRRTVMYRVAQDADAEPVSPDNKNAKGIDRLVVFVRRQTPTTAPLSTIATRREGGHQKASPQGREPHTRVRMVPVEKDIRRSARQVHDLMKEEAKVLGCRLGQSKGRQRRRSTDRQKARKESA